MRSAREHWVIFFGSFITGNKYGSVANLDFDQEVYLTKYGCVLTRGENLAWVIVARNHEG